MAIFVKKIVPRTLSGNAATEVAGLEDKISRLKDKRDNGLPYFGDTSPMSIGLREFHQTTGIDISTVEDLHSTFSSNGYDLKRVTIRANGGEVFFNSTCPIFNRAIYSIKKLKHSECINAEIAKVEQQISSLHRKMQKESIVSWTIWCGKSLSDFFEKNNIPAIVGIVNKPGVLNVFWTKKTDGDIGVLGYEDIFVNHHNHE